MTKKVAIIMGSDSDLGVMMEAADKLKQFDIPYEVHIISAHRTPAAAEQFASAAIDNGFGVIIAGAGKAAIWAASWPLTPPCRSSACPSRRP